MCVDMLIPARQAAPPSTDVSATGKKASQPKPSATTGDKVIIANPRFEALQIERISD
jgi:hypothetical protein